MSTRLAAVSAPYKPEIAATWRLNKHLTGATLGLSGLAGFCMGIFVYPSWQVAVEAGQVVAGLVQYPPQNPFYLSQIQPWTILNDISALFLKLGVSEKALSYLLSGICGMVTFQALALAVLALSGRLALALAAPFFTLYVRGLHFLGLTYAVMLLGRPHTYGIIGLSTVVLVLALIARGHRKVGGVLLGLAPAVHPSLGIALAAVVLVASLFDFRFNLKAFRPALKFVFLGYGLSALSFGIHLIVSHGAMGGALGSSSEYLAVFTKLWSREVAPFPLRSSISYELVVGFVTSLLWLSLFTRDIPRNSRFLLAAITSVFLLATVFSVVNWIPDRLPQVLQMFLPSRLFNVNLLLSLALSLGLLGRFKRSLWIQTGLLVLVTVLVAVSTRYPVDIDGTRLQDRLRVIGALAALLILVAPHAVRYSEALFGKWTARLLPAGRPDGAGPLLRAVNAATLCVLGATAVMSVVHAEIQPSPIFLPSDLAKVADRTNSTVLADAASEKGILLTCSDMWLIQLLTRRPVLLEGGALDYLPWTPQAGPGMEQILQYVYGVDLLNPPADIAHLQPGRLLTTTGKSLWESRGPQEWSALGKQFGFTNLLCYPDWRLQLPEVAHDDQYALYAVP